MGHARGRVRPLLLPCMRTRSAHARTRPHARPPPPRAHTQVEYRVWNPFRSKLAASILAGVDNIHIKPGCKLLYLGAASGTSVSHCSDLVGPEVGGGPAPTPAQHAQHGCYGARGARHALARACMGTPALPPPLLLPRKHCHAHTCARTPQGAVYAVEFSHRSGRDLVNMAKQRPNVIPIIEDARHPQVCRASSTLEGRAREGRGRGNC